MPVEGAPHPLRPQLRWGMSEIFLDLLTTEKPLPHGVAPGRATTAEPLHRSLQGPLSLTAHQLRNQGVQPGLRRDDGRSRNLPGCVEDRIGHTQDFQPTLTRSLGIRKPEEGLGQFGVSWASNARNQSSFSVNSQPQ